MKRADYVRICGTCTKNKMDPKRGLVCSLTDTLANFEKECPDYEMDLVEKERMIYRDLRMEESSTGTIPFIGDPSENSAKYGGDVKTMKTLGTLQAIGGLLLMLFGAFIGFSLVLIFAGIGLIISGIISLERANKQFEVNKKINEIKENKDQE